MRRIFFFLLAVTLWSQSSLSQTISYKVKEDDPYNVKPIQIDLVPFYADAWGVNITIGWQAEARVDIGKRLSVMAGFRKAYLDINGRTHAGLDLPNSAKDGVLPKLSRMEACALFNFIDKNKSTYLPVVLSSSSYSSGGYTYTNSKSISVPAHVRKIVSLKGGMYNMRTAIAFNDIKNKLYGVNTADKTDTLKIGEYGTSKGGSSIYNGYSVLNTFVLSAGISFKSITNLSVYADGYGRRSNKKLSWFYIDYLFAPAILVSDVYLKDGSRYDMHIDAKKYSGWKIGWFFADPNPKILGFNFKTEMGSRPGIKGKTLGAAFIDFTCGFTIGFKSKLLEAKK